MSRRTSGWITGRSQLAFLIGLILASGAIFWLEKIRFESTDDPLGSFWIDQRQPPTARVLDAGARTLIEQWRPKLADQVAALSPTQYPSVVLLAYASCLKADAPCATQLRPLASEALEQVAAGATTWPGPLQPSLALVALTLFERNVAAPDPRPAWQVVARWLDGLDEWSLGGLHGLAQFISRSAALTGNEFAAFRSYASLRPVLETADGLTRLGEVRVTDLSRGLGLLSITFPRSPLAKILLWHVCTGWPGGLEQAPLVTAVLCWSNFAAPEVNQPLATRLSDSDLTELSPLDTAIVLLALTTLERGPLLVGN